MLGIPVEVLSMRVGHDALHAFLDGMHALPLRDFVPFDEAYPYVGRFKVCCRDSITRSEPGDDLEYSVLALMMLESDGRNLKTVQVAQHRLRHLPVAATYTAERTTFRRFKGATEVALHKEGDALIP